MIRITSYNVCYTKLLRLYNDQSIFVALRAIDYEPDKMVIKGSRRDQLTGDMAGIAFDSYHDHRTGFEFDVTSAGQKTDMIMTNPMVCDFNWNAVWDCKTGIEDSAWVAEFEIPFSQLRYGKEKNQTWGLHIWRWIARLGEESDWEKQTSTGPGIVYLFGHLKGLDDIPRNRRIELMPYVSGDMQTFKNQQQNPFTKNGVITSYSIHYTKLYEHGLQPEARAAGEDQGGLLHLPLGGIVAARGVCEVR